MRNHLAALAAVAFLGGACGTSNKAGPDAGGGGTCAAYCTTVMANCATGHTQYSGMDQCLASCTAFPVGMAGAQTGDSLACRTYHAGAAATDPTTHCPHAGPSGDGVCGSDCEGYCDLAIKVCTGANQVYTNRAQCMSVCMATPGTTRFVDVADPALAMANQQSCLVDHSQEASVAPADHCTGDLMLRAAPDNTEGSITCN